MKYESLICVLLSGMTYASFAATEPTPQTQALPAQNQAPAIQTQTPVTASTPINCNSHFPKEMKVIDTQQIEMWSKNATLQLFTFSPTLFTEQLAALKSCFTDQGWQSFNNAFEKSGNLEAIKIRALAVSSQATGGVELQTPKNNQWKSTMSIDVTYQNKDQTVNQSLKVNLLITRKSNGDLGIMQVIAVPEKKTASPTKS